MIRDLKPYSTYRNPGVQWLRKVPEHWEIRKLKFEVSFQGGGTPAKADEAYWNGAIPWVSPKDMKHRTIFDAADHITDHAVKSSATNLIAPGAVLVVVRSGILRRSIPVAINAMEVALNQDMKALRPRGRLLPAYLQYLIEGNQNELLIEWTKQGATVESIEHELMANSRVPIPSVREQSAIVHFLDYADRLIRRYVLAKRKLVKILEEHKQVVIQNAVVHGVRGTVTLKQCGVDGLGDLPESWAVRRIASFSPMVTNGWVGPTRDILRDSGTPYIQSLHIKNGKVQFKKKFFVDPDWLAKHEKIRLKTGDVVVVQTGDIGQVACIPRDFEGVGCHALIIIRTKSDVMKGEFLDLVLRSKYGFNALKKMQTGALHPHLNCTWVREIFVPVPPMEEQEWIVREVGKRVENLNLAIARTRDEIDLVREYGTRLIADVVTGKLDVREAAANLPDEAEEPEELLLVDEALTGGDEAELASEELAEEEVVG